MIKVENMEAWGFEHAVRGMRNSYNSWDKSDSFKCDGIGCYFESCTIYNKDTKGCNNEGIYILGKNDLELMRKLIKSGSSHRKFLRQIFVSMDITAPLYWWSQFDTNKIGVTTNSCSKMHRLLSKPFEMNDFSFDQLSGYKNIVDQFRPLIDEENVTDEIWTVLDSNYDVSNFGRIKHKFKNHYRFISGSLHKDGYIFVTLYGKQYPLHRIVAWIYHNDTYKKELVVNHKDGNKQNNFECNLEWVTTRENIKHSIENNLQPKSINTYKGKFTAEDRDEIKRLWDNGDFSMRRLAKKYGVSHTCIHDIIYDTYKYAERINVFSTSAKPIVDMLNELRDSFFRCENEIGKKNIWYAIIQLLPSSYNQKRTVTMNYENILNIINQRENHKLDEWKMFIKILRNLPYFNELFEIEGGEN